MLPSLPTLQPEMIMGQRMREMRSANDVFDSLILADYQTRLVRAIQGCFTGLAKKNEEQMDK
jgi:hypothetical protein